jgi:hypothetical protein
MFFAFILVYFSSHLLHFLHVYEEGMEVKMRHPSCGFVLVGWGQIFCLFQ